MSRIRLYRSQKVIINEFFKITVIFLFFVFITDNSLAQSNCEFKKSENGIKVYSCETSSSPYNAVKAEFEVNGSIDDYISLLLEVSNYQNWKYRVVKSSLIKKVDDYELIYRMEIDSPWPVSDRDLVEHLVLTQDPVTKQVRLDIKSDAKYIPEREGFVRIPKSHSILVVTPFKENLLKVSFYIEADPGGILPAWVANMVSIYGPLETFGKVKEILNLSSLNTPTSK